MVILTSTQFGIVHACCSIVIQCISNQRKGENTGERKEREKRRERERGLRRRGEGAEGGRYRKGGRERVERG